MGGCTSLVVSVGQNIFFSSADKMTPLKTQFFINLTFFWEQKWKNYFQLFSKICSNFFLWLEPPSKLEKRKYLPKWKTGLVGPIKPKFPIFKSSTHHSHLHLMCLSCNHYYHHIRDWDVSMYESLYTQSILDRNDDDLYQATKQTSTCDRMI